MIDERHACPACRSYYTLSNMAPPLPSFLAEHGSDDDIERWEAEHDYNIASCSACGWREDEDG
jgi:hypothetical protein